jgi:hypothetical protein
LAASSRGGPSATPERAGRFLALESSRDFLVFGAISVGWPICWPCGKRVRRKRFGVWRYEDREGITSCNGNISFSVFASSALCLLVPMVCEKSKFWEKDNEKGRRLKKRFKIESLGRKGSRLVTHFQSARIGAFPERR